jgi:hypothetical protein
VIELVDSAGVTHRSTVAMTAASAGTVRVQIPSAGKPTSVVLDPDVALLARLVVTER